LRSHERCGVKIPPKADRTRYNIITLATILAKKKKYNVIIRKHLEKKKKRNKKKKEIILETYVHNIFITMYYNELIKCIYDDTIGVIIF
jgi:hypothetical protein